MHVRLCILEIIAQMLRQRFDSRLRRVIGRVAGRIRNALLTTRDDNRTGRVRRARLKGRNVRVQPVDHAEQIGVQNLSLRQL